MKWNNCKLRKENQSLEGYTQRKDDEIILQMRTVSIHLTSSWECVFRTPLSVLVFVSICKLSDWLVFWMFITSLDACSVRNWSQLLPSSLPTSRLPVKDALRQMFEHKTERVTPIDSLTWSMEYLHQIMKRQKPLKFIARSGRGVRCKDWFSIKIH